MGQGLKTTIAAALAVLATALATTPAAGAEPGGAAGRDFAAGELLVRFQGGGETLVELPAGADVNAAAAALSSNGRIAYATPNYIAHTAAAGPPGFFPDDRGNGAAGGWQALQWNFLPCGSACAPGTAALPFQSAGGIDAPRAWAALRDAQRPGATGVRIAVVDTGIAYRDQKPKFVRSPDFSARQFTGGHDFIDDDRFPLDNTGHGTHVAGTIGEQTGNGKALTGLAYGAKLMPVRAFDGLGEGKARDIAQGLTWAVKHGARVINMSFEFGRGVQGCKQVPTVCRALRLANRRGVTVVAAAGNDASSVAAVPARLPGVIGVGASTEGGCLGNYSNHGAGVELIAPGGKGEGGTACASADRPIFQLTIAGSNPHVFGFPSDYAGTSMASAHVAGVAAMVIASGELGPRPSPARVLCQLTTTARRSGLGEAYDAARWGAGLLDAGAAVSGAAC
jgi:serine protease